MLGQFKQLLTSQFEAALCMMDDCVRRCQGEYWDGLVAKYPFWQVAYHALCFVDLYLSPGEQSFALRPELHPQGWHEFNDEYPSRRFEREELRAYLRICRRAVVETIASESTESLIGP